MVGAEKFPREIHDDGLALAGREAHVGDPAPAALRVLHLEIGEDDTRLPSLGERQVDARVRREDPPVEKQVDTFALQTAQVAEVENQVVERGDALVACERERRHVAVVPRAQRGQPVGALLVGRGNGRAESRPRNGVQAQLRRPRCRRYEPLVYVHVHGIRMVHGEELHRVEVAGLPQLFGHLQDVAAVSRREGIGGHAHVFARRVGRGRRDIGAAGHDAQRHPERAPPHDVGHEAEGVAVPCVQERARSLEDLLLQTVYYPGTEEDVLEQQILKGSCPFLYAWDGHAFSFVTDVMWRSALGMPLGIMAGGTDIASAPPHASREYMRIPGRALAPRNGRYILQLTEELWETAYLDQAQLLAVDHPDSVDVYVDEGFLPPAPGPAALRLYPVSHPRPPIAATDEHGTDWLAALRARDDRYVAPLTLTHYQGLATLHDLILDFGELSGLDSVYLLLAGWIYPTDASINIALAQSGKPGVIFPYLEVKDPQGRWRRVADVPFPSGKNKTVIVDLSGKFLSADHRVRIRTNMEIYWDQAFVAAAGEASAASITTLDPMTADLHYRGFSRLYRKGGRYAPEWAAYEDLSRESPWEPIVGRFTRYGDVLPLVRAPDDMYVIMAPGDETTLTFDASAAPPLPPGWTRDFLLYTDAWLKDSDRNTAAGGTVAPLPFHGMSRYPYGSDEAYPRDAAHQRYLDVYNTRRVERYRPVRESATSSNR